MNSLIRDKSISPARRFSNEIKRGKAILIEPRLRRILLSKRCSVMLIIPCSWKRLEYGNFFLDREYKSPWLKQSKSQSNIHFSLRSSGSLVSYVTRGRVLGFIAVGEGWCRPPRPYFFFNKTAMKTSLENLICCLLNFIASFWTRSICQM